MSASIQALLFARGGPWETDTEILCGCGVQVWPSSLSRVTAVEPSPAMSQLGRRLEAARRFAHPHAPLVRHAHGLLLQFNIMREVGPPSNSCLK